MYSATDLARMFNTSRTTIYSKLKDKDVKEFVKKTKSGTRLMKEGLSTFQLIISESKINQLNTKLTEDNSQLDTSLKDRYINNLEQQIEDLKKDKQTLFDEKNNILQLLKDSQKQIFYLTEPKKKWWKFWQ